MHAWLAKPVDWLTIQLAQRCVKAGESGGPGPALPLASEISVDFGASPAPVVPELTWALEAPSTGGAPVPEARSFQYPSAVATAAAPNNTVFGRFYPVGKSWAEQPTVVLLHGWNAELCYRYMFPYLAKLLREAQINAAMIELPYHMRRRPREGPVTDFISSDLQAMLEAARQAVLDTRALCRWLQQQGCPSVGLWGFSLGAWIAGLTARVEPALGFAVLTTPVARMDLAIAELAFCAVVRRSLAGQRADLSALNLAASQPQLSPKKILLVAAEHDLFAPAQTVEQLWQAWGHPEIWRVPHGHISVLFSARLMARTVGWIGSQSR